MIFYIYNKNLLASQPSRPSQPSPTSEESNRISIAPQATSIFLNDTYHISVPMAASQYLRLPQVPTLSKTCKVFIHFFEILLLVTVYQTFYARIRRYGKLNCAFSVSLIHFYIRHKTCLQED